MPAYKPSFICPHCEEEIPVTLASPEQGALGACDCEEARRAWELEHRAAIEARKKRRGRRSG